MYFPWTTKFLKTLWYLAEFSKLGDWGTGIIYLILITLLFLRIDFFTRKYPFKELFVVLLSILHYPT